MQVHEPVNSPRSNPATAYQSVRIIAVPHTDTPDEASRYLVECSECGPLGIMSEGMHATCRDHLRSHGAKL